jgi:glycosyltransferase involved in cell wall biosynthesis
MKVGIVSPFKPHDLADLLYESSRGLLPEIGGVTATPVTPMAREWHHKGHDLSIFTLDPSVTRPYLLKGDRLSIHVLPKRRSRQCLLDCYSKERRLIRIAVASESPKVLSAQWTYDHALAALDCGLPTSVTCHDTPLRYAWISKHWYMTYHLLIAWRVIKNADHIVCVSPYTALHIKKYFKPGCPVDVIPNGLLPEVFQRGERRLKSGRKTGSPYTICSVGGWGGLKNIMTLLRACSLLQQKGEKLRLVLFGWKMGEGEEAQQWASSRGLAGMVEFRGSKPRKEIFDFLEQEADLMVHPSLIETHGMVLIEAMACGVPVVGGEKSGAVPWTLDEGGSGYLCDMKNAQTLAETILKAMHQPDNNETIAERAWNSVHQRFRLEAAAAANERVLRELAAI